VRWLAQLTVSGRLHAISLAVGFVILPFFTWLGAALAALVVLSKGPKEGGLVFASAMLPALVLAQSGDRSDVIMLALAWLCSVLLWWSKSWTWVLAGLVLAGSVQNLVLPVLSESVLTLLMGQMTQLFEELAKQNPDMQAVAMPAPDMYLGAIGASIALGVVISVMVARNMQATLYNPGGFRIEFHALRLSPQVAIVLLAMIMLLGMIGGYANSFIPLMLIPLIVSGIALVHGSVAKKKLGGNWLVIFYIGLIIMHSLAIMLLVVLAVMDSFIDFRSRIQSQETPQ
jgi:hypothetical protein